MTLFSSLHPRHFMNVLQEIDTASLADKETRGEKKYKVAIALMVSGFCLLVIHYIKYSSVFQAFLIMLSGWMGYGPGHFTALLATTKFLALTAHAWWGAWHVIGYVLIPVVVIKYVFNERIRDYGLQLGGVRSHLKWYVLLLAPILCFVVLASFRDDFLMQYPFYRLANRSWVDLLLWEAIYLLQFVCLEFFFRGFMLQSCRPALGSNAVFVMCVPYMMIHFQKPWLEASGAILFGLFLGVLAMRARSIWGGVLVHATVALSMDMAALIQGRGMPGNWWPS